MIGRCGNIGKGGIVSLLPVLVGIRHAGHGLKSATERVDQRIGRRGDAGDLDRIIDVTDERDSVVIAQEDFAYMSTKRMLSTFANRTIDLPVARMFLFGSET